MTVLIVGSSLNLADCNKSCSYAVYARSFQKSREGLTCCTILFKAEVWSPGQVSEFHSLFYV